MNELALFAGAGGGILSGQLLGWRTVCAVERDAYAAAVLAQRQNEGLLDLFPIWSDVCTFDGKPWRGIVDVISGGFPCQDISVAGGGAGIEGSRSGLWSEFARIIGDVRPRFVFVENSPALTIRGLGTVLGDLAAMGFDAEWGVLSAAAVGALHRRERIWILAFNPNPNSLQCSEQGQQYHGTKRVDRCGDIGVVASGWTANGSCHEYYSSLWSTEPAVGRVADGVAYRVDRLKAIGNGQVPQCAAEAFCRLHERIKK